MSRRLPNPNPEKPGITYPAKAALVGVFAALAMFGTGNTKSSHEGRQPTAAEAEAEQITVAASIENDIANGRQVLFALNIAISGTNSNGETFLVTEPIITEDGRFLIWYDSSLGPKSRYLVAPITGDKRTDVYIKGDPGATVSIDTKYSTVEAQTSSSSEFYGISFGFFTRDKVGNNNSAGNFQIIPDYPLDGPSVVDEILWDYTLLPSVVLENTDESLK